MTDYSCLLQAAKNSKTLCSVWRLAGLAYTYVTSRSCARGRMSVCLSVCLPRLFQRPLMSRRAVPNQCHLLLQACTLLPGRGTAADNRRSGNVQSHPSALMVARSLLISRDARQLAHITVPDLFFFFFFLKGSQ